MFFSFQVCFSAHSFPEKLSVSPVGPARWPHPPGGPFPSGLGPCHVVVLSSSFLFLSSDTYPVSQHPPGLSLTFPHPSLF